MIYLSSKVAQSSSHLFHSYLECLLEGMVGNLREGCAKNCQKCWQALGMRKVFKVGCDVCRDEPEGWIRGRRRWKRTSHSSRSLEFVFSNKGRKTLPVSSQVVSHIGFVVNMVSVVTTQLCWCSTNATIGYM